MSWDSMQAMRKRSRAEGQVKAVGVALASYARKGSNLAWASNEELMASGFSKRKVQYALRELERLGEIHRRPDLETYQRRRVYEVDPDRNLQLSIFDAPDTQDRVQDVHPVEVQPGAPQVQPGAPQVQPGARHARTCKERKGTDNNTPPNPPSRGERASAGPVRRADLPLTSRPPTAANRPRRSRRSARDAQSARSG